MNDHIKRNYVPLDAPTVIQTLRVDIESAPAQAPFIVATLQEYLPPDLMLQVMNVKPDLNGKYVRHLGELNDSLGRPVAIDTESLDDMNLADWLDVQNTLQQLVVGHMLQQSPDNPEQAKQLKTQLSGLKIDLDTVTISNFGLESYVTEKFDSWKNWMRGPVRMIRRAIAYGFGYSKTSSSDSNFFVLSIYAVSALLSLMIMSEELKAGRHVQPHWTFYIVIIDALSYILKYYEFSKVTPDCRQLRRSHIQWDTLKTDSSKEAQLIRALMSVAHLDANKTLHSISYGALNPGVVGYLLCLVYASKDNTDVMTMLKNLNDTASDAHFTIQQSFQVGTPSTELVKESTLPQ